MEKEFEKTACAEIDTQTSYGAFVAENGFVLMVYSGCGWSFPKGHPEADESPAQTAIRETFEETGIRVSVDCDFSVTVKSARPQDKRNIVFFKGKSLVGNAPPVADEVQDARWIPIAEALKLISNGIDNKAFELLV